MSITDANGDTIAPLGGWRVLSNSTARKTINLSPAPSAVRKISIEDTVGDAAANNITINPAAGELIDGQSSLTISTNYQRVVLESTGTGWTVLSTAVSGLNTDDNLVLTADSIEIRNAYSFPTDDGTNGQVLKTDGAGTLTWQDDNTGSGGGSSSSFTGSLVYVDYEQKLIPSNIDSTASFGKQKSFIKEMLFAKYEWPDASATDLFTIEPYYETTQLPYTGSNIWASVGVEATVTGHYKGASPGNMFSKTFGMIHWSGGARSGLSKTNVSVGHDVSGWFSVANSGSNAQTFRLQYNAGSWDGGPAMVHLRIHATYAADNPAINDDGNKIYWVFTQNFNTGSLSQASGSGSSGSIDSSIPTGSILFLDASNTASYGGSGATWTDLSDGGKDATIYGSPTYNSTDKLFEFSGNSQYMTVASGFSDFTNGFTFFTVADLGSAGSWERLIDFSGTGANSFNIGRAGTAAQIATQIDGNGYNSAVVDNNTLNTYAVVLDGSTMKIYKNGSLADSTSYSYLPNNVTRTINYIGKSRNSENADFEGKIGLIAMYNRDLTATEISDIHDVYAAIYSIT